MTSQDKNSSPHTMLDLDSILADGWADPAKWPVEERERAAAFYAEIRKHDDRLLAMREKVAEQIQEWTGCVPRDFGSFGARINLATSDIDLGIGYPPENRDALIQQLEPHMKFEGERQRGFFARRLVFSSDSNGTEIDLSAVTDEDFALACSVLDEIDAAMTDPERIAHTWVKHLLRESGRVDDYGLWKVTTYGRFWPEYRHDVP